MSKFINKLQCNFTQVSNEVLLDSNLSSVAFKLYSYIVYRLSTNSEWDLYEKEIKKHFQEGDTSFKKAKYQLIEAGYIKNIGQQRRKDGTVGAFEYEVYSNRLGSNWGAVDCPAVETVYNNTITNKEKKEIEKDKKDSFLEELKSPEIKNIIDSIYKKTQFGATGGIKQALQHYTDVRNNYTVPQIIIGLGYLNKRLEEAKTTKEFIPIARIDRFFNIKENQDSASCWLYWYEQAMEYGKKKFKEEEEQKAREIEEEKKFIKLIEIAKKDRESIEREEQENEIELKNTLEAKKKHDEIKRQLDILREEKETQRVAFIQEKIYNENLSTKEVAQKYRNEILDILKDTEEEMKLRKGNHPLTTRN